MKEIQLTQCKTALVDDDMFEELNKWKWCTGRDWNTFYAHRHGGKINGKQKNIIMHRVIMNAPFNMVVDHKDGNGLNNQRSNLRVCTQSQNMMNRGKQNNNKSGYKGVSWEKHRNKWKAQTYINKKHVNLGRFDTKEEAYKVYCDVCEKYHGEFAHK